MSTYVITVLHSAKVVYFAYEM
uniref:Uncharacterized protein n=1 Tax=Arundo donax TaxID=35708 RepID=A0A0A9CAG3_ARUDO